MSELLHVQGLGCAFRHGHAVWDLWLRLGAGRVLLIAGPNGAGKTTLLRMLATELSPTSGTARVAHADIRTHAVDVRRRTAWVPTTPELIPFLTPDEFLRFVALTWGVSDPIVDREMEERQLRTGVRTPGQKLGETMLSRQRDWEPRAAQLISAFQLDRVWNDRPRIDALSLGERHKLAIVGALLQGADVLLFDEPLNGLDPAGIRTFSEHIRQARDAGAAVCISSHLITMVEDLATDLLILREGRAQFNGTVEQACAAHPGRTLEQIVVALSR